MLRWSWLILVTSLLGCASMQVDWDYDPAADFSSLHRYDWLPVPKLGEGGPRLQYDSLLEGRVKAAVDEELGAKGFRKDPEHPDFLVTFSVAIDRKLSVTYLNELYGYGPGWGPGYRRHLVLHGYPGREARVSEYDQGTLIVDIVRADTRRLIWRGTATDEVYPDSSPQAREKRVREAIHRILSGFPPKVKP
ncbi:MAG TPA: DUF4136 domain-containing protein [Gammaproteobacteria bacterium]|nr:DUF4136 domain-containing protein [Gammaproteobacteria bacterium]